MTLPGSGQISMYQINIELGRGCCPQISLDAAENGGYGAINTNSASRPNAANPATLSEWWGYNHNATPPCPPYGTFLYYGCVGFEYAAFYADGGCGTYYVISCYDYYVCGGQYFLCQ